MLELRPIVVDDTFVALGGNMRYRALITIDSMSIDELAQRLSSLRDFNKKAEVERQMLINYWGEWKNNPTVHIIKASELSKDEQREFIIKDNVGYGEWDMDAIANEWDTDELEDWGFPIEPFITDFNEDDIDKNENEEKKMSVKITFPNENILNDFLNNNKQQLECDGCILSVSGGLM